MSYYAVDANGYVADVASVGGWAKFVVWAEKQDGQELGTFLELGKTLRPKRLAEELRARACDWAPTDQIRQGLAASADGADGFLLLTDGTSNDEDGDTLLRSNSGAVIVPLSSDDETLQSWAKQRAEFVAKSVAETTGKRLRSVLGLRALAAKKVASDTEDDLGFDVTLNLDDLMDAIGDRARAEGIGGFEGFGGVDKGQKDTWSDAVDQGVLDAKTTQRWTATQRNSCEDCLDLDGVEVGIDEDFPDGAETPLHIGCECVIELVGIDDEW